MKPLISVLTTILLSTGFYLGTSQTAFASRIIKGEPPSLNLDGTGNPNSGSFDSSRLDRARDKNNTYLWDENGTRWYYEPRESDYRNVVGLWMDKQFNQDQARLIVSASQMVFDAIHDASTWNKISDCAAANTRTYVPRPQLYDNESASQPSISKFMQRIRERIVFKRLGPGSLGARRTHKYISYYLVIKKVKGSVKSDGSYYSGYAPVNWFAIATAQSVEGSQRSYQSYVGLIGLNDHLLRSDGAHSNKYDRLEETVETIFHEMLHNFSADHSGNYANGEFMTEAEKCLVKHLFKG